MRNPEAYGYRFGASENALFPLHVSACLFVGLVAGAIGLLWIGDIFEAALVGLIVAVEGVISFFLIFWRTRERAFLYALFEGGRASAVVVAIMIAVVAGDTGVGSVAQYLSVRLSFAVLAVGIAVLLAAPIWQPTFRASVDGATYGLPIVLAASAAALLFSIDRYAIAGHVAAPDVSAYVAHAKLSQVLSTALTPFFAWFGPKAVRQVSAQQKADPFLQRAVSAFFFVVLLACANFWLLAPAFWQYVFPKIQLDRALLLFFLVGVGIYAMGNPLSVGALRPGKTYQAPLLTAVALAVAGVGSVALSTAYGAYGAAAGRSLGMASYTVLFAVNTVLSLKLRYPWLLFSTAAVIVSFVCGVTDWGLSGQGLGGTLLRCAALNACLLVIWALYYALRRQR
jgi:O-antigen/teichoic acid export membrane protein